MYIDTLFP